MYDTLFASPRVGCDVVQCVICCDMQQRPLGLTRDVSAGPNLRVSMCSFQCLGCLALPVVTDVAMTQQAGTGPVLGAPAAVLLSCGPAACVLHMLALPFFLALVP